MVLLHPTTRFITFIILFTSKLDRHIMEAKRIDIDLAGNGCDQASGFEIGDDDIAGIFHKGSFNTIAARDDCYVTLRTDPARRLEYVIGDARFQECGITITVYDSLSSDANPKAIVDCGTGNKIPIQGKTNFNTMRIHLRKSNTPTNNFQFSMQVINDRGPNINYRADDGKDVETDPLEPGIIVGIAIAGVIIIIALILLAIYLCIRARQDYSKDGANNATQGESSVYTSGNSQHLFANKQYPRRRYGSTEDVRSTTSSQEKTNGAYANSAYSTDPNEKKSDRSHSLGRSRGKTGFTNDSFYEDQTDIRYNDKSWEEGDDYEVKIGSFRKSRIDSFKMEKKQLKSAMKKQGQPSEIEMSKVNTQPINSILKKKRVKSPNRSQTSSTEGSFDANAMVYGYNRSTAEHPNVKHKPVIERRRSRSGTRSNRSGSSGGYSGSRRAHSADRKPKPKPNNSRMYGDVFIDDRDRKPRSSSRSRTRSRSHRGSDSVDSESSAASSRRVNMNPGGKRVHIKGEETDI